MIHASALHRIAAFVVKPQAALIRKLWIGGLCLVLASCGGGQDEDKVTIGLGQSSPSSANGNAADYPIFYVKRVTPDMTMADDDMRRLRTFSTNADLYKRDRASPSAVETNITARVREDEDELWDVKDVDVSHDGTKVIFAMRGPLDPDQEDDEAPTWNIWEYVIATDTLRRVITSDVTAEEGQDVSPHYLPDGHILFSSTRQRGSKAILLDENKTQFEAQDENRDESAFVLHILDPASQSISQITFNQSHDLDASVLADGRVMWSRWDHANNKNGIHLYTANPDGTDVQLLYGAASHNTIEDFDIDGNSSFPEIQFVKARQMRDGRTLAVVRPFSGTDFGGDLYIIDTDTYVEDNQAAVAGSGMTGPAQTKATANDVLMIPAPSPGGRFAAAVPLWDGSDRILTAWSQCRLLDENDAIVPCTTDGLEDPDVRTAPPLYSVWMYDPGNATLQPVVPPEEGVMVTEVATAQPRTVPTFKPTNPSNNPDVSATLAGEGVGIIDIQSVYDFDGTVSTGIPSIAAVANPTSPSYATRPARYLRIEKAVSLPDDDIRDIDNSAFGVSNFMREILGYVPVEPDGSVRAKVPANVAFQISVLDANGRRLPAISRHNAWLSLRPGETVTCNGCHIPTQGQDGVSGESHGRKGVYTRAYAGAASGGQVFAGANPSFVSINAGDTMARARAAWSCSNEQCRSITPSVDILYSEVWPSAANPRTDVSQVATSSFKFTGPDGLKTAIPTSSLCTTTWSSLCRVTINYLEHIQPIWERPLGIDVNADMAIDNADNCIACHNRVGAAGAQIPAGQLELTSDASDQNGAGVQVTSYRELLFGDNALELNGNVLQDRCVQFATDPVTMQPVCVQFQTVARSLIPLNARNSPFFAKFAAGGSHRTGGVSWLSSGELKLISEWVDIGAQYYNDPFKAPEN